MNDLRVFIDDTLLPALPIESAYNWPGHNFAAAGDRLRGACPFHESKTGSSFVVTPSNSLWWCQGCAKGGDVILYRHLLAGGNGSGPRGSTFVDLVRTLCAEASVTFPERELSPGEKKRAEEASRNRFELEAVYVKAAARLWTSEGDGARTYLFSRGLTEETIREYGLGLAGDEVREEDRGYILLPWRDERGRPLTYYGRWPGEPSKSHPKTKAMPGEDTKRAPFALDRVHGDEVVVVEGDLDTLILRQAGDDRVVSGISGTLPQSAIDCLARRGIRRAFICGDPDGGGRNGNESNVERLQAAGVETYVVEELPDGQDPDEYVLAHGIEEWRRRVQSAMSGWTWIGVQRIGEITPESGDAAKNTVIRETLEAMKDAPEADREEVVRRLAKATGRTVSTLRKDTAKKKTKSPPAKKADAPPATIVAHRTEGWRALLDQREARDGTVLTVPNYRNAAIFIEYEDQYAGRIRFDEFSGRVMLESSPWSGADLLNALEWAQAPARIPAISKDAVNDAVSFVAHRHAFHPIRDYLNGLVHDGAARIDKWLVDHAGAADTPYVRAVSSKWLIAAVARVMRPGCQVDTALILESPQGTQKSTAVGILGAPWASTLSNASLHGKDAMEQISGKWLVEMAELSGMSRSEVSQIKDFLSRRNDFFRPSYGRVAEDHLRQCVFVGSTNDAQYLRDETGNRRFWPVKIGRVDVSALALERDQIWAEATARFHAREAWHLAPEMETDASEEQELRRLADSWEDVVGTFLDNLVERAEPGKWPSVSVTEVLRDGLGIPHERHDQTAQNRVVRILAANRWTRFRTREGDKDGKPSKRYRPDRP